MTEDEQSRLINRIGNMWFERIDKRFDDISQSLSLQAIQLARHDVRIAHNDNRISTLESKDHPHDENHPLLQVNTTTTQSQDNKQSIWTWSRASKAISSLLLISVFMFVWWMYIHEVFSFGRTHQSELEQLMRDKYNDSANDLRKVRIAEEQKRISQEFLSDPLKHSRETETKGKEGGKDDAK